MNNVLSYEALKIENERLKLELAEAQLNLVKPLAIGELLQRLKDQTNEEWVSVPTVRKEHAAWSDATFGNVGPVGPLNHLSKEAMEAAEDPQDLLEWADMQFLFWDAQRRAGITDEQIEDAMIEKLAINKTRKWPAPKDGEAREHIRDDRGDK